MKEKKLLEHSVENQQEMRDTFVLFLEYIVKRIENINYELMEIKSFIEQDSYAKKNAIKFKPFFDDINKLYELMEHIYDNMPYEY